MPGYRVTIRGHWDERKRPLDGSAPRDPVQIFNVDANSDAQLGKFVDERIADICGCNFMKVPIDPNKKELGKLQPWVGVPLSSLTHVSWEVRLMAGEVPVFDKEEGKSIVPSGKKVVVN